MFTGFTAKCFLGSINTVTAGAMALAYVGDVLARQQHETSYIQELLADIQREAATGAAR